MSDYSFLKGYVGRFAFLPSTFHFNAYDLLIGSELNLLADEYRPAGLLLYE